MRLLGAGKGKFGILDAEQNLPLEAADQRVAKLLRIGQGGGF